MEHTQTVDPQRRQFSPAQKVAILREHLLEAAAISDVCDRHHISPTLFYRWQKELFENGAAAFAKPPRPRSVSAEQDTIQQLHHKLQRRDEALAELMQDHVALKTSLGVS